MKIRAFTQKESNEIKALFRRRMELVRDIHELGIARLENAYNVYVRDFAWNWKSPLTFKPYSMDKFISYMYGSSTSIGTVENPKSLLVAPNGETFPIIYGGRYYKSWEFVGETDNRLRNLVCNTFRNIVACDESREFISVMLTYAQDPFELSMDDIKRIDRMREQVQYLENELHEINLGLS